ncbi:MAG: nucleotidyltransferase family protein [Thalassotalea sp.]|nr:nucleotidyltransferase family protein [Thalassotalea sp.]
MPAKKDKKIAAILLAAGNSRRLGQPKQLVEINDESLLSRQLTLAERHCYHSVIVLGYQAGQMQSSLLAERQRHQRQRKPNVKDNRLNQTTSWSVVHANNWQEGMGSSLASGIKHILASEYLQQSDALVLLLVDQWQLKSADMTKLIDCYYEHPDKIIVSDWHQYDRELETLGEDSGKVGHNNFGPPVIFPARFFTNLSEHSGAQGAKAIISKHLSDVVFCKISNAEADLDTPEQLAALGTLAS